MTLVTAKWLYFTLMLAFIFFLIGIFSSRGREKIFFIFATGIETFTFIIVEIYLTKYTDRNLIIKLFEIFVFILIFVANKVFVFDTIIKEFKLGKTNAEESKPQETNAEESKSQEQTL